jgi:two-component system, NarL family, sensor kinase
MKSGASVPRAVLTFALLGLVVLALIGVAGTVVLRRLATDQALDQARAFTRLSARVVERRVTDGLLTGDAGASAQVAAAVFDFVLSDPESPVVRVKIWDPNGTIVYSDETRLIGETYTLGAEEREALRRQGVSAELSDLDKPENRFDRSFGQLLEVYTPIQTPDGTPLLFETYQRQSSVANSEGEIIARFAPVLIVALLAFGALEIPLAWALARRVQSAQRDRERFLQRALDASAVERRRIARDLHDGPVQELTGLAMGLAASAERAGDDPSRLALRDAAAAARSSIRTLRSATVGIDPPSLRRAGLGPALSDLTARLQHEGVEVAIDVEPVTGFGPEADELLYRACREALRNVEAHAGAARVDVRARREDGRAVLEVADDGRGIAEAEIERAQAEGHLGLMMMDELAREGGGTMSVTSRPGGGTLVRIEVPA